MQKLGEIDENPYRFDGDLSMLASRASFEIQFQWFFLAIIVGIIALRTIVPSSHPIQDIECLIPHLVGMVLWGLQRAQVLNSPKFGNRTLILMEAAILCLPDGLIRYYDIYMTYHTVSSIVYGLIDSIVLFGSVVAGLEIVTLRSRKPVSRRVSFECWFVLLSAYALGLLYMLVDTRVYELMIVVCVAATLFKWIGISTLLQCPVLLAMSLQQISYRIMMLGSGFWYEYMYL
jgi:hypothetical protein